jgi:hypothetical protein
MEYYKQRFVDELNEEGDIEIRGVVFKRHDVLVGMDTDAHAAVFSDWTDQTIIASKDRAREFLLATGCLDRFRQLCHRQRQGNILPFVGAGMSVASGFLLWGDFLKSLIHDAPEIRDGVEKHIDMGEYEEAAQLVRDTLGDGVLTEEIHNRLGSHQQRSSGPVNLLPSLFISEVVTTNFDYVLTKAYANAGCNFSHEFCGSQLREAPRKLASDPHCLLRLHGEAEAAHGRVLTLDEYRLNYEDRGALPDVLNALAGVRGFLFLGCSLQTDRTYEALREMKARAKVEPSPHYAFLPLPSNGRLDRRRFLEAAGIHPIYYPAGDHEQSIEDLLITIQQGGLSDD